MTYIMIFILSLGQVAPLFQTVPSNYYTMPSEETFNIEQKLKAEVPSEESNSNSMLETRVEINGGSIIMQFHKSGEQIFYQKDLPESLTKSIPNIERRVGAESSILEVIILDRMALSSMYHISELDVMKVIQLIIWQEQIVGEKTLLTAVQLTENEQNLFMKLQAIMNAYQQIEERLTVNASNVSIVLEGNRQIAGPYQLESTYDTIRLDGSGFELLDENKLEITSVDPNAIFYIASSAMDKTEVIITFTGEKKREILVEEIIDGVLYISMKIENFESEPVPYTALFPKRSGYLLVQVLTEDNRPLKEAIVQVLNESSEVVETLTTNVAGMTESTELLVGEYSLRIDPNNSKYEKEVRDKQINIKESETMEQSYHLVEILGTIIIQFLDEESRELITSFELYKVEDEKKHFISEHHVETNEIAIPNLASGQYILKQNQRLQQQRKDVSIPFVIEKTNQSLVLEASREDFKVLANTGIPNAKHILRGGGCLVSGILISWTKTSKKFRYKSKKYKWKK